MKSLQHVLWRGALALSLMAIGVGSGLGMPPAEQADAPADCTLEARALVAEEIPGTTSHHARAATVVVVFRQLTPVG